MRLNSGILKIIFISAALFIASAGAWAQCESNVPEFVEFGQSYCFQVCSDQFFYGPILLTGIYNGIESLPVLIFQPGCSQANTHCETECTPLTPPAYPFELYTLDPAHPIQYYGDGLPCLEMFLHHEHDAVWGLEIYAYCDGCFCLTFDDQLAVQMRSGLSATEGNGEVSLSWATASENNNARFEITRNGVPAGSVDSRGNTATGFDYTWTDGGLENGTLYTYTLTAVDLSGTRRELGTASATPHAAATVASYALYQNYPNPFNPNTSIAFDLPEAGYVTLRVYNPVGEQVSTLVNGNVGAGRHTVAFDGRSLTSGLYFYTIAIGDRYSATRKMLLVK